MIDNREILGEIVTIDQYDQLGFYFIFYNQNSDKNKSSLLSDNIGVYFYEKSEILKYFSNLPQLLHPFAASPIWTNLSRQRSAMTFSNVDAESNFTNNALRVVFHISMDSKAEDSLERNFIREKIKGYSKEKIYRKGYMVSTRIKVLYDILNCTGLLDTPFQTTVSYWNTIEYLASLSNE